MGIPGGKVLSPHSPVTTLNPGQHDREWSGEMEASSVGFHVFEMKFSL